MDETSWVETYEQSDLRVGQNIWRMVKDLKFDLVRNQWLTLEAVLREKLLWFLSDGGVNIKNSYVSEANSEKSDEYLTRRFGLKVERPIVYGNVEVSPDEVEA